MIGAPPALPGEALEVWVCGRVNVSWREVVTMKIVVLGSRGQLGTELMHQIEGRREVSAVGADVEECDIGDAGTVRRFFDRHGDAGAVINCAAFTAVDDAEKKRDLAMEINAMGAGYVAACCRRVSARLVHISTDFVFGDGFAEPIGEWAEARPLSVYGMSKRAGEVLALQNNEATAVLRTSGLYSPWGPNFARSIAEHAASRDRLEVVDDQWVSPTPVGPLAEVAIELARAPLFVGGVYHGTAHGGCTWREFAQTIVDLLGLDCAVEPTTAAAWGAPARRPAYSVLDNGHLRLRGLDRFRRWDEELARFLDDHGL